MICKEINNLLPAYLEDILSPEEKKSVESHLASCLLCSRGLADLKKAENLVKGLEEVEPPPFFEQRIMARVREEAGQKKGILRKFFYPLHIKIPIQISAMFLVAVLAFYVYQKNEPEMQRLTPFPIPLKESGKGQLSASISQSAFLPRQQSHRPGGHQPVIFSKRTGSDLPPLPSKIKGKQTGQPIGRRRYRKGVHQP